MLIATYTYDGLRRRIKKVVEGAPDVTYHYYWDEQWRLLELRKDEDSLAHTYRQFIWGVQYIDAPIVRFDDTDLDDAAEGRLYYTYDANFNVTGLVGVWGNVTARYGYDPYGKVTFMNDSWDEISPTSYNDVLFQGRPLDTETGLYDFRNRMYHPMLGRWMQRDPLGYGDGMGLYEFEGGGPTQSVDPSGSVVEVCCRDPQVGYVADALAKLVGKQHCWLRTSTKSAGMGPAAPGPLPESPCCGGVQTQIRDHSEDDKKPGVTCYALPDCDECCVDDELEIGKPLGEWTVRNHCNTFIEKVLTTCKCENRFTGWDYHYTASLVMGRWLVIARTDIPTWQLPADLPVPKQPPLEEQPEQVRVMETPWPRMRDPEWSGWKWIE